MGRGVSSGGGRSSLGYLFGGGGENIAGPKNEVSAAAASQPTCGKDNQIPAGIHGTQANNYFRADGQNCGNFLTVCICAFAPTPYINLLQDRPSTKVQAAPGGGSSLDYLFGGRGK